MAPYGIPSVPLWLVECLLCGEKFWNELDGSPIRCPLCDRVLEAGQVRTSSPDPGVER
jgi:hypothetical protein